MKLSTLRKIDALLQAAADEAHLRAMTADEAWSRLLELEAEDRDPKNVGETAARLRDAQAELAEMDEVLADWEAHEWR